MNTTIQNGKKFRLSLSASILLGLILGILCGLFFGEYCRGLAIIGHAFIKLLQMSILPYIIVSLIVGIGSLSFKESKLFALKGGLWILVFWAIGLAIILTLPLTFPAIKSASFFSQSLVQTQEKIDYLNLFIPSNPIRSMADNIIPAVVVFSIAVGVALIGLKDKQSLIQPLSILSKALTNIARFMVKLAPIGVFAISASFAGTMTLEELGRLHTYFITYFAAALFLTFWVLPMFVATLTPFKYKDILGMAKDALITGFTTDNLFIILPILIQNCKDLFQKYKSEQKKSSSFIDIIIPVSFNFPHIGKLLALLFILFAAWFYGNPLPLTKYPAMALLGLLSFFGKAYSAIPFLLDSMHIPSDIFNLYKIAAVVTGRFSTLLAAMHLLALSLVAASAISGLLEIKFKKILTFAVTTFALLGILMTGARILQSRVLKYEYTKDKVIAGMQLLFDPVEATVHKTAPPGPPILRPGQSVMDRIQESGILRVGYDANKMPASYFNANEDLVGFDIDMAHQLAREIGVSLEFIPFEYQTMTEHLREGQFDIIMSAIPITTSLLKDMTFSDPYLDLTFALAVKDYRRQEFASLEDIQRIRGLKIGIHWRYSYFHDKAKSAFPLAEVVGIDSIQDYFGGKRDDIDVLLISAEGGSAWTLLHPEYQIVIPKPTVIKQPIGYPVAGGDLEMINFLNRWIDLKKKDGTIERIYNYWILGMGASEKEPRWSILRNVLHWVD